MNKHFTMFNKKQEGLDESKLPKELEMEDYYLTVYYSNSENREDTKVEIRQFSDFETPRYAGNFSINLKDTMFTTFLKKEKLMSVFEKFKGKRTFDKIPEKMIVMHTRDFKYTFKYHFFEVKEDSIEKINIPDEEESQERIKDDWRIVAREVRSEFAYFSNYKF